MTQQRMLPADAIKREVEKSRSKINSVRYGKVTFIIQDGVVLRCEITDSWQTERAN